MLEIIVENKSISDIILKGKTSIFFRSNDIIIERMKVKFFCDGIYGKSYIEGFIKEIYSRELVLDENKKRFKYFCEVTPDLIVF